MKKIITRVAICTSIFTLLLTSRIYSQSLTEENIKAQMIKDWERAKTYTVDYLNTMPADKYSFRADKPAKFCPANAPPCSWQLLHHVERYGPKNSFLVWLRY